MFKRLNGSSLERFVFLSRCRKRVSSALYRNLSSLGTVEVIADEPGGSCEVMETIWIPDEEAVGFEFLMSNTERFPAVTAWSRAFVHLARTLKEGEAVWLVEDDVAGDGESFARLVERTTEVGADLSALEIRSEADDAGWYWWGAAEGFFEEPWRSFNPLCRLSGRLVRAILDFREARGKKYEKAKKYARHTTKTKKYARHTTTKKYARHTTSSE